MLLSFFELAQVIWVRFCLSAGVFALGALGWGALGLASPLKGGALVAMAIAMVFVFGGDVSAWDMRARRLEKIHEEWIESLKAAPDEAAYSEAINKMMRLHQQAVEAARLHSRLTAFGGSLLTAIGAVTVLYSFF